ncbi:hypothetical protein WJX74_000434 [Apatococcus lobatus]|uniref:Translocator protein n=1 Tax=Apatococcus lobatus TaxID=904363 RepID=A0AAW1S5M4_9CHLO
MPVQWGPLAIAVGIPVGAGFSISLLSATGLKNWFPYIRKPSWEPPPWFFGPCWSLLYTLMGVASYLVWRAGTPLSATAFKLYGTQLIFNLAWQPLFFAVNNMTISQIDNLAALGFATATALAFREISRTASLLMVPYISFLVFANALNFQVARLNPGGRPPREHADTDDLARPQDMKNPGQDGYRPATQAALSKSSRQVSHRARVPLKVMASAGTAKPRTPNMRNRAARASSLPAIAPCAVVSRTSAVASGRTAFSIRI